MKFKNVCVIGGAGYVGSKLVPKLLAEGYNVSVLDLMIYGTDVLSSHPNLTVIEGDIRNQDLFEKDKQSEDSQVIFFMDVRPSGRLRYETYKRQRSRFK